MVWVAVVNGFFVASLSFHLWEDYAGIGLPQSGIHNLSIAPVVVAAILLVGIMSEAFRLRVALFTNVGVYAIAALYIGVSAMASAQHSTSHDSVGMLIFVIAVPTMIAIANLLLYLGVSPFQFGDC
jgi:hypothetical protein